MSAGLSPFSGGHLAADESHFMPMSSRYIPLPRLRNSPARMSSLLRGDWPPSSRERSARANQLDELSGGTREITRRFCAGKKKRIKETCVAGGGVRRPTMMESSCEYRC